MFTVTSRHTFLASHRPPDHQHHQCSQVPGYHSHTYVLEVSVTSERLEPTTGHAIPDQVDTIEWLEHYVRTTLDNADLTGMYGEEHTTPERLAALLFAFFREQVQGLASVSVGMFHHSSRATYQPGVIITSEHLTQVLRSLGLVRNTDTGVEAMDQANTTALERTNASMAELVGKMEAAMEAGEPRELEDAAHEAAEGRELADVVDGERVARELYDNGAR